MKRSLLLVFFALVTVNLLFAQVPQYTLQGSINLAPSTPKLTAVDPMVYAAPSEVVPPRPFLYTVDKSGITITRFNDNIVVGRFAWPSQIYVIHPDGSWTLEFAPAGGWEPVAMTVSYPTVTEFGNRGMTGTTVVKPIPDLTPPPTLVYVVMAHSGLEWKSNHGLRDTLVPMTSADTESSMLIQLDVSDPSFSTSVTPTAATEVGIVAAILGHGAGQPVYDRGTGNVYVGNMPSTSLTAGLTSFVSKIRRLNVEGAFPEAETGPPGAPVIRCGPQHPENGIPVGRPQAYACYDPGGSHPIDDNEHVGAAGNYFWEFRNLPDWLKVAHDLTGGAVPGTGQSYDGILYGTPPTTGEWFTEARVTNLDEVAEGGTPSEWTPIRLLVTPTAEYLPIKAQFAAGVPAAYQLEGTGSCGLTGAPAWIDVAQVPNGCVVMGRAPLDGEYYNFAMPGFTVAGYPTFSVVFSGNVFGSYDFVPLTEGVGLSGLAWHQVSKVPDPSTETAVLSVEYIGVEPSSGQLYKILAPPGRPQPPNERPPETALTLDLVSSEGAPLTDFLATARPDITGHLIRFGEAAVEADRDIFVAAVTDSTISDGALIQVSKDTGVPSVINLPGVQAYWLGLDSDLRTAIIGVEPGQVDHNVLWVTGTTTGNVGVIDTDTGAITPLAVEGATSLGSVSVDFGTRFAYVAAESLQSVAIFGPSGSTRPPFAPRIWSAEEISWNQGDGASWQVLATGDPVPTLSLLGELPAGLVYTDNLDGTATFSGTPTAEGNDYAYTLTASNGTGTYAQAFGIALLTLNNITSVPAATFTEGVAGSFTVTTDGWLVPVVWELGALPTGLTFTDTEEGYAYLVGTPAAGTAGTYTIEIHANGGFKVDGTQAFTLTVNPATVQTAPVITSASTATMVIGGVDPPVPFLVTSTGSPMPVLSTTGALPNGVTFVNNGNSTATLTGTPVTTGTYPLTFTATKAAGAVTQAFTLIVERETSMMGAVPATLSFVTDGTFVPAETVSLTTTGDTLPYAITSTATWLAGTPVSGMMPGSIAVSANAAELAPGTYTGTIIVNSAGTDGPPATVAVTLTVVPLSPPGMVGIWPSTLRFDYKVNGTMPPPQTVWVMSGGAALNYTVSTGGAKWLVAPASGTAPGGFSVSVDPRVGVGLHIGSLTIADSGNPLNAKTIPVTLVKTAGDADLVQVMFDVGGSPEGLALNRNTHNLFITSSSAAAEAGSEAGGESGSDTEVTGPPEPSTVYHINPVDKTLVAEIVVHSEGEYVAVNSTTGRAYHASQGTGEVAVIDGATNTVVTFIALTGKALDGREGAFQPYQIAIDEAQNLIYVGAKAPPIPDPPSPAPGCKAIHEMPDDEYDCWNPGLVFVIDGNTNQIVSSFFAGDDPEGVVFASATKKVYASNEDDGSVTIAKAAKRNDNGSITPPQVLSTIIRGVPVAGWWQPACDENNYCGERGQAALWPNRSACNGLDDEAEEADKMAVDPSGNVYIIDDRYRVAKINGLTGKGDKVLEIPGYDCELEVPDGSDVLFRNTANNIALMPVGKGGKLYVTSEQNTLSLIDPATMTIKKTLELKGAGELDAITTDPELNRVYITDEDKASLWILKGRCANGSGPACRQ